MLNSLPGHWARWGMGGLPRARGGQVAPELRPVDRKPHATPACRLRPARGSEPRSAFGVCGLSDLLRGAEGPRGRPLAWPPGPDTDGRDAVANQCGRWDRGPHPRRAGPPFPLGFPLGFPRAPSGLCLLAGVGSLRQNARCSPSGGKRHFLEPPSVGAASEDRV